MTVLEFLARAARARLIAADLAPAFRILRIAHGRRRIARRRSYRRAGRNAAERAVRNLALGNRSGGVEPATLVLRGVAGLAGVAVSASEPDPSASGTRRVGFESPEIPVSSPKARSRSGLRVPVHDIHASDPKAPAPRALWEIVQVGTPASRAWTGRGPSPAPDSPGSRGVAR